MTRAAVLGAGSWGTTFAKVLVDAGTDTVLWCRRCELAKAINADHVNADYLPTTTLPPQLRATSDPAEALSGVELVVFAIPSQTLRTNLEGWLPYLPPNATLVSLIKGIELGTVKRMSEVIAEVAEVDQSRVVVVSGPNLAAEIAAEQPTACVVAGSDSQRAAEVQAACTTRYYRPYTNSDVIGTELCGTMKNIIALACGLAVGMGFGDNTVASLITRGLAETARLGGALGAEDATFAGLAGVGDLVATCASPLSRNRSFGVRLGRGGTIADALAATGGQVAEGVQSCRSVLDLAERHGVDVPITRTVESVCFGDTHPAEAVGLLMGRSTRSE
jgi:glycerol-3-phosphate dehydrogenase (NAD(P)+)